jgi:hypothetical protein
MLQLRPQVGSGSGVLARYHSRYIATWHCTALLCIGLPACLLGRGTEAQSTRVCVCYYYYMTVDDLFAIPSK